MPSFRALTAVLLPLLVACRAPGQRELDEGNRLARAGDYEGALGHFVASAQRSARPAVALSLQANALLALGRPGEAAAALEAARSAGGGQLEPGPRLSLLRAQLELGELDAGLALAQGPALPPALEPRRQALLALLLLQRAGPGDAEQALAVCQRQLGAAPAEGDLLYAHGSALLATRRFDEASAAFRALEALSGGAGLGAYGQARLAAAQGRRTDVIVNLRRARAALGPKLTAERLGADPAFRFMARDPDFEQELKP